MRRSSLLAGLLVMIIFLIIFRPANPFDLSETEITIPTGSSARAVHNILHESRILPRYSVFALLLRLSGQQSKIKAGQYALSPSDPLPVVIAKLLSGDILPAQEIRVTFPEGMSIYKMGETLKEKDFTAWRKFQRLTDQGITYERRQRHWGIFKYIASESLEGYLFPDTYELYVNASAEALAEKMLVRFEAVILPYWDKNKKATRLSLHEILTLASIIEKEAKKPPERAIIASVFYNRLNTGLPLAADPTIKYALERPSKIVYLDQLTVKSPYNTYKRRGLPPGPICNPGLDSFKAALYPAKTKYFFFVAKNDGSHLFSRNWAEHQKARLNN